MADREHRALLRRLIGRPVTARSEASVHRAAGTAPCRTITTPSQPSIEHTSDLTSVTFTRITVDPKRMGGVPCVRDLRFPVATVVAVVADGMTVDEILGEHPDLEAMDIAESLRAAALAVQERELPLRQPA